MSDTAKALTWKERVYAPLTDYLRAVDPNDNPVMSFHEIEQVIGARLPLKAREDVGWWWSVPRTPHGRAWLRADRRAEADLREKTTTFVSEVFNRGRSLEDLKRMRADWLGSAR